jgi:hypothetical protein
MVFFAYLTLKVHELKYMLVIIVCTCSELYPMTHEYPNLEHYYTSYMLEKPQYSHVFYMHGVVFEHDMIHIFK